MKKRITALLLCLVMVFSLIPTSVWASEILPRPAKTPTFSDVKVQVKCSADSANHPIRTYDLSNEDFRSSSSNLWDHPDYGTWHYTIVLNRAELIKQFDKDTGKIHTDTTPNADTRITLNWDSDKEEWVQSSSEPVVIECGCKTEIVPPTDGPSEDDVKAALGNLWVKCINGPKTGSNCTPCKWPAKLGYSGPDSLTKVSDTEYTVELGVDVFVNAYTKRAGEEHGLMSAKTLTWVLTFDKESSKWGGAPKEAGVDDVIQVAHRVPVHVVIYRNGDTSKAYADIALNSELPDTVIDLTKLKIGNYYTANYTGKYDFYGWYDDGLMNVYKANVAVGKDAPAGLTTKTVNGWTNFKCMVYDYENVVYFQTKEAMEAYQADHSKTEGILKSDKVLYGQTVPTYTPERAGYTFQYWSREGQSVDVAGQTVNGWTNLYGVWTITPHNIYAYARLNSAFAPLTKAEFGGFIKLNATTLKDNLGLNVEYNENGYISIGKFNFDAMPLTEDMYFGDDAELDAVKAQSINLENGVSADTADQIAWTFLYQVDNSDYMTEAGYPTDDENGYQLAGNLNVAAVMFNAGGDNVENMPAVNYTYDDGFYQIHDFYFAGKDFTLPADPTREGYIFKGWEATVIPGEDDADCYADPTTDAGAETQTLYKAGDAYTITDGGVIFTAQWAKKTYFIGPNLRINGGETVKAPGKNYSWSPRYGGEYQDVINYNEVFEDLTAKVEEVDRDNKPSKIEIKLCFPGTRDPANATPYNETILTYGQTGGGWNPGVKNTAYIWGYATTYYDVSFDSNGGTAVDMKKDVQYGTTITKPADPTREGYNFLGWFDKDGNAFDFDTEITRKTVLTAQWAKKDYVIASDLRINGGDANLADGKTYAWTYRYGGKFEETIDYQPMLDALKARAMKVDAANDPVDSDITLIVPGSKDKTKFNDVVTYYGQDTANWQAANKNTAYIWGYAVNYYNVTFDYGTEDIKNETLKVKFNDTLTAPKPERDGYTFKGWYTDADCTEGNEFNFTQGVTKTMTLYAGWQVNTYVVTFDSNGGSAVEPQNVDYRAKVTKPVEPTREGYHFMGWFNGDKEWNFDEDTMGAGNMTLTAKWEINKYTVSFDSKGGIKVDSQIVEHGSTATKPGTPHRNDYTFKGWYLDGKKFDFSTPITGDITLVAVWATKTSGGSNSSSDTTTKDNGKTVQSGKTFDGGIALYVGLSVLSATGSALVITKKKRG